MIASQALDGAVAQRYQNFGMCSHLLDFMEILFTADGPFNQGHVRHFREILIVYQRAVNQVRFFGDGQNALIDIQKGHVAAGAAIQPDCC
jgi:hypothetical protein